MFTVDASVHINALNQSEAGSADSQAFLERLQQHGLTIVSPTLLLVELAAAAARALDASERGIALAAAVRQLPRQVWVPLDDAQADLAGRLAAEHRLRGADAVYAAVARFHDTTLVTLDRQQLERLPGTVSVQTPVLASQAVERSAGAS